MSYGDDFNSGFAASRLKEMSDENERLRAAIMRVRSLDPRQIGGVAIEPYILGYRDGVLQAQRALDDEPFDAEAVAKEVAAQTPEVLRAVESLEQLDRERLKNL